jgi:hypothetical protein
MAHPSERGRRFMLALAVSAALMFAAVVSTIATTPPNTYTGCLVVKQGTLYNVAIGATPLGGGCKPGDSTVSWNEVGPMGPAGPTGSTGPTGPSGAPGTPYTAEWDFSTGTCTGISGFDCDAQTQTQFPAGSTVTVTDVEIDGYTNVDSGCTSAVFYAYAELHGQNGYYLGIINFDPTSAATPIHPITLGAAHTLFGTSGLAAVSEYCYDSSFVHRIPPVVSGKIIFKVENPTFVIH